MRSPRPPANTKSPARRATASAGLSGEALEALRDKIEIFLVDHPRALLSEPGRELLDLSGSSFSLNTEYGKLIWHIWSDRTNLVRQITGIAREVPGRLELTFQRFGKGPPGTLIVADTRADAEALNRRGRRIEYLGHLRRWLAQLFPGVSARELTTEASLKDSLSGCYARGLLHEGGRSWAVIGVGPEESPAILDGILTYGIIWLELVRVRHPNRVISGLKVFVPHGFTETTQQRMAWMNREAALWELYETGSTARMLDARDAGNLRTRIQPPHMAAKLAEASEQLMLRVESLGPHIVRRAGSDGLLRWSVNGLVFARQRDTTPSAPVVFGLGRAESLLDEQSLPRLERLANQVLAHRRAQPSGHFTDQAPGQDLGQANEVATERADEHDNSSRANHPLYRLQPEQWLDSVILAAPELIVPDLQPGSLTTQVFSVAGREQGLADLIGITLTGRLLVMELKTSEDIHLPLQALDYWIGARWHLERGGFAKEGFFARRAPAPVLADAPPRLLLISPGLQFHPTCQTILRYFSPQIEVEMIGINEAWREGLQVVFRK